jgi:hypothetical protein
MALNLVNKNAKRIGDCETCERTNLALTLEHRNMWMCEFCVADEKAIITKIGEANVLLEQSRVIDSSIQMKPDMFVAKTIPIIELQASIQQDENIPASQKDSAYAKACNERYLHFKEIVFQRRAELNEFEQEMRAWQVNAQTAAGKLRSDEREKYRHLDINYVPTGPVKSPKAKSTKAGKPKESKEDFAAAIAKYDVPAHGVKMMMISKHLSAMEAAAELARMMNKTPKS